MATPFSVNKTLASASPSASAAPDAFGLGGGVELPKAPAAGKPQAPQAPLRGAPALTLASASPSMMTGLLQVEGFTGSGTCGVGWCRATKQQRTGATSPDPL